MKILNYVKNGLLLSFFLVLVVGCSNLTSYTPQTYIVEILNMEFQPADLKVHQGDTVIWINKDIVAHDVTEEERAWGSPTLASDSSWKKVIMKSDSYYCSIHVIMKGKLTVEE